MVDHTIQANFDVKLSANNVVDLFQQKNQQKMIEDIITRMALSICPKGTTPEMIPPSIMSESWKAYSMNAAMMSALEEIKGNFSK